MVPSPKPGPVVPAVAVPVSRVRRYRIQAELRAIKRQSVTSGVPVKTIIQRKMAQGQRPEDLLPIGAFARIKLDQALPFRDIGLGEKVYIR
jgi:hypothetical protein